MDLGHGTFCSKNTIYMYTYFRDSDNNHLKLYYFLDFIVHDNKAVLSQESLSSNLKTLNVRK